MENEERIDLYYSEGPGTTRYFVLRNATRKQVEEYKRQYDWYRAVWEEVQS